MAENEPRGRLPCRRAAGGRAGATVDRLVAALAVGGLFAWFFGQVVWLPRFLAYRDTDSFYQPLLKFVHEEWTAGRIPLWNPFSCGGAPLLAQGTPAVLYPLQLVFRLPLRHEVNLNSYILLHFVLAACFTYALSRRLRTGPAASALAACAYIFGGSVLMQYGNLPYLCSAAWMPAAWYATWEMFRRKSLGWALALAGVSALMLLAGDPQAAYHALVLAALAALVRWTVERRRQLPAGESPEPTVDQGSAVVQDSAVVQVSAIAQWAARRWRQRTLPLLFVSGAAALLLSAVQVLPTLELTRLSSRSSRQAPDSVYQIPGHLFREYPPLPRPETDLPPNWYDTLVGNPPPPQTNYSARYDFSFVPWRLLELVWPNFSGKLPYASRWLLQAGGEGGRSWFPSAYLGVVPLILGLLAFNPLRRRPTTAWLSWIALLATLASFGDYGPVWLFRLVALGKLQHSPQVAGGEVGGLYWLLVTFLPAYDGFRYPSKLLALTALAVSLLAAQGLQVVLRRPRVARRVGWVLLSIAGLSCAGLAATLFIPAPTAPYPAVDYEQLTAPAGIDVARMASGMRWSFGQTLLVAVLAAGCLFARSNAGTGQAARLAPWVARCLLLLTAIDLAAANGWSIFTKPYSDRDRPPALVRAIAAAEAERPGEPDGSRPFPRIYSTQILPIEVFERSGDQFPLAYHQGRFAMNVDTFYLELFDPTLNCLQLEDGRLLHARRMIDAWGIDYFVWPKAGQPKDFSISPVGLSTAWHEPRWAHQPVPGGPPLPLLPSAEREPALASVAVAANPSPGPRVWICRRVLATAPVAREDLDTLLPLTLLVSYSVGGDFDLRTTAWVEDRALRAELGPNVAELPAPSKPDQCEITEHHSDEIHVAAKLDSPGLLVLTETAYPGWRVTVESANQAPNQTPVERPILRVNRAMRGVVLPAGQHRLIFRYQPASFWRGAAISGLAWLGLLVFGLIRLSAWARGGRGNITAMRGSEG